MGERFRSWTTSTIDASRFLLLRKIFTAIWILYDVSDLLLHGATTVGWRLHGSPLIQYYTILQIVLVIFETAIFFSFHPRLFAFACLLCRGCIASYWPLNDFLFYCIIMLIFSLCKTEHQRVSKWPIDVLNAQIAWVYFSTAVLKINPAWMTGGGLYVRIQEAKMFLGRAYPQFIESIFSDLTYLSILARIAIIGELAVSLLLLYCLTTPNANRYARYLLCFLVCCIHIFAAITVNVLFFGAVMISMVVILNFPEKASAQ